MNCSSLYVLRGGSVTCYLFARDSTGPVLALASDFVVTADGGVTVGSLTSFDGGRGYSFTVSPPSGSSIVSNITAALSQNGQVIVNGTHMLNLRGEDSLQ